MKWGAVIGSVALAALASLPARAADMTPIGQRAIPATTGYIPAQFYWTGFYIGLSLGGGWGTTSFLDPLNPATASPSPKGFQVGVVSGVNYQIGSLVFGVEGDFTNSWAKGSVVDTAGNSLQTEVLWTSSITGRLGWAFDRLMIYGKGGAGFDYDRDTAALPNANSAAGTAYRFAWTVGAGVEYAVTEHWIARLGYDYFRFPMKAVGFQGNAVPPIIPAAGAVAQQTFPGTASGLIGLSISEIKFIAAYKL
jgi:outer membrane immunogenic protein